MKKSILTPVSLVAIFLLSSAFAVKIYNTGIAGRTGSPGEGTCNACHAPSTSVSTTSISSIPAFIGNQYIAGQTYTLQVTVSSANLTSYGFGCEVLNASNTDAGVMQSPGIGVKFLTAANGRKNAVHTTKKSGPNTATFEFEWVAPMNGNVYIYAVGNAVNSNGNTSGDAISNTVLNLTQNASATGIEALQNTITAIKVFPNPVQSNFKVEYTLLNAGDISLVLFDVQGKMINKLVNEFQTIGQHKIEAQIPEGTKAGIYFLKFMNNEQVIKQRMILVQ